MPLWPCLLKTRLLGSRASFPLVNWLIGRPTLSGNGWPRCFSSSGFGSKRSSLARPADHEHEDDALGPRWEMRGSGSERVRRVRSRQRIALHQPSER